jgi:Mg2+ and Co2+ transporter CorA
MAAAVEEGMSAEDGLVDAYVLDGSGGARRIDWAGVPAWRSGGETLWVHIDRSAAMVREWLAKESGLEPLVARALIAEETRPRSTLTPSGLLVILVITGLLGVNVGGIPGQNNEMGFWIVTLTLLGLGAGAVWLLRRRKLF